MQSWDDFFVELRKTWKLKVGRGNTIEKLQRETFNVIVDWFAWFHGSELFSRGRARAIEELMQSFSWLIVLEGEKFKDKCRWMEAVVEEQQSKVMRWEVAVFLRGKFLGVAFNPFELHLLKEEYKRVGRAYLRKHYKVKFANADTNENAAIKAIFLPPKRRRKQPVGETYSFREKHQ